MWVFFFPWHRKTLQHQTTSNNIKRQFGKRNHSKAQPGIAWRNNFQWRSATLRISEAKEHHLVFLFHVWIILWRKNNRNRDFHQRPACFVSDRTSPMIRATSVSLRQVDPTSPKSRCGWFHRDLCCLKTRGLWSKNYFWETCNVLR